MAFVVGGGWVRHERRGRRRDGLMRCGRLGCVSYVVRRKGRGTVEVFCTSSSPISTGEDGRDGKGQGIVASSRLAAMLPHLSELDQNILRIMLPAVAALSLDPLMTLADTAFLRELEAMALGGVGISTNVFNLTFTCFNFLAMATTPRIAVAYGQRDYDAVSRIAAQSLWIAIIVGGLATSLLGIFTLPVVKFFGASDVVAPFAVKHLRARIISAPAFLSTMVFNGTFRGHQDTKTPFLVGMAANLINLACFYVFIRVLGLGVIGAGLAVSMQQIAFSLGLLTLLVRRRILRLRDMRRPPGLKSILSLLSTGVALTIRTFSIFSTVSYGMAVAGALGPIQTAAFEISRQIFALFARLFDGISVAAQSLIPVELGKKNYDGARRTARRLLQLGSIMGFVFFGLVFAGRKQIASIFSKDLAVRAAVMACLPIIGFVQPINGLVFVFDGIFTGGRQFNFLAAAVFASASASWASLWFVKTRSLGLDAVWISLSVMMCLRAVILGFRYKSSRSPVPK